MHAFFSDIQQKPQTHVLGLQGEHTFRFPTFFFSSNCTMAGFLCPLASLKRITADTEFQPLTVMQGKGMLVASFYQHRQVDEMQPYDEVVLSIPVFRRNQWLPPLLPLLSPKPLRSFGHLILDMPVNSELNRLRGNLLWNLPKSSADIHISSVPSRSSLQVNAEGLNLSLDVDIRGKIQPNSTTSRIYGRLNGQSSAFINATSADFCKANAIAPVGARPAGKINWKANPGHPLEKIDTAELTLFETRYSTNYKSVLYLPGQECQK